ncbi:MAG TPA: PEPxxWA-CTERM sorting domain-containing protein [Phenylobacterium sp.]|nr:PEPxxWA-CTERM sorting domain-containing protein [Phenylobacterium sp.]
MKTSHVAAAAIAALAMGGSAHAAILNAPVPVNAYITYNGLNWAWASPLDFSSVDLSYQSQFGWRLPTAQELANAPSALMFIFAGANAQLNGAADPVSGASWAYAGSYQGAAAVATPYFSSSYYHADFCNGVGSNCGFGEEPWAGQPGAVSYSESLVVRNAGGAVPEPATWAMMICGFGMAGAALRRRRLAVAA